MNVSWFHTRGLIHCIFVHSFEQVFWLIVILILEENTGQEHCHTNVSSSIPNDLYNLSTNIQQFHTRVVSFNAFLLRSDCCFQIGHIYRPRTSHLDIGRKYTKNTTTQTFQQLSPTISTTSLGIYDGFIQETSQSMHSYSLFQTRLLVDCHLDNGRKYTLLNKTFG